MGITTILWVENPTQSPHRSKVILRKLLRHEIDLFDSDAMLSGDAASKFDAFFQNVMTGSQCAAHLVGLSFIVKHERVNISVAGVEHVRDAQPVFLTGLPDESHDVGKFRSRHHPVLS